MPLASPRGASSRATALAPGHVVANTRIAAKAISARPRTIDQWRSRHDPARRRDRPDRDLENAKSRLGGTLDAEERRDLVDTMIYRTIRATLDTSIAETLVVSPDRGGDRSGPVLELADDAPARQAA